MWLCWYIPFVVQHILKTASSQKLVASGKPTWLSHTEKDWHTINPPLFSPKAIPSALESTAILWVLTNAPAYILDWLKASLSPEISNIRKSEMPLSLMPEIITYIPWMEGIVKNTTWHHRFHKHEFSVFDLKSSQAFARIPTKCLQKLKPLWTISSITCKGLYIPITGQIFLSITCRGLYKFKLL